MEEWREMEKTGGVEVDPLGNLLLPILRDAVMAQLPTETSDGDVSGDLVSPDGFNGIPQLLKNRFCCRYDKKSEIKIKILEICSQISQTSNVQQNFIIAFTQEES